MTIKTIFATPGHIDVRAFTVFGASAKTNSNPIGYFGTGLKYAIAGLVRRGIKIQLFIGTTEYEFYTKKDSFRGTELNAVMLRKRKSMFARWSYEHLPFTTQLGRNWELWQVFRELFTNTMDEHGRVFVTSNEISEGFSDTMIVVHGDEFYKEYENRDTIFLPTAGQPIATGAPRVVITRKPSKHVYWRGMRVYDHPSYVKPMYQYDITAPMDLTEDRTLKYTFYMHAIIVDFIVSECSDRKLIDDMVGAPSGTFEHKLDYQHSSKPPSDLFTDVVAARRNKHQRITFGAGLYYDRYAMTYCIEASAIPWYKAAAALIREGDWTSTVSLLINNQDHLAVILDAGKPLPEPAPVDPIPEDERPEPPYQPPELPMTVKVDLSDDMPF